MYLNDNESVHTNQSVITLTPSQASTLFNELKELRKDVANFEKILQEQEFRKLNPPTYVERVNAILLPSMKEYTMVLNPFTGFFGFHHYYYTNDLSLAIMCCIFPVIFWMMDLMTYFFHKQHLYWKYIRIFYTFVFYFFGIVCYVSFMDMGKKIPSPEITTFFFLYISNAIGIESLFWGCFLYRMLYKNEYFSIFCFMFVYYKEFTQKTTKLNDVGIWTRRILYTLVVCMSIGYYKNLLLDKESHMRTKKYFLEIMDLFSFSFQQANIEIKNNVNEIKKDLIDFN